MATEGVLIFDDEPVIAVDGGSEQTFIVLGETQDVLVFDPVAHPIVDDAAPVTNFVVFDVPVTVTETVAAPPDFMLVDAPKEQGRVVLDGDLNHDLLVLTPGGPPGPPGPPGPIGATGLAGPGAYFQEFGFATPATTWTIAHGLGTLGLSVETVDTSGEPLEGYVRYVDPNVIEIDWYYPTAGAARVFR